MRCSIPQFRSAWSWFYLLILFAATPISAAERISGILSAKDSLTSPNQPATVEALLISKGMVTEIGLGGEPLELLLNGKIVASAMTGGDGRAFLSYTPRTKGTLVLTLRVGSSPRVAAAETQVTVSVWERRSPMIAVEMAALMEDSGEKPPAIVPLPGKDVQDRRPMPDAADELNKLSRFYFNLLYVVPQASDQSGGFVANDRARAWLKEHKFPQGHVLVLANKPDAWGTKLDDMRAAGWTTLKVGIARSKSFAEAFIQRRLDAVMVPEPEKGEAPRKVKVAKEWKEVRKKL